MYEGSLWCVLITGGDICTLKYNGHWDYWEKQMQGRDNVVIVGEEIAGGISASGNCGHRVYGDGSYGTSDDTGSCGRMILCQSHDQCVTSGIGSAQTCAERATDDTRCAGDYIEWRGSSHCFCNPTGRTWTAGSGGGVYSVTIVEPGDDSTTCVINDFSSVEAMHADGWSFGWTGNRMFTRCCQCDNMPSSSYCGYAVAGAKGEVSFAFNSSGTGTLDFGNPYTHTASQTTMHLNNVQLSSVGGTIISHKVNFTFN